MFGFFCCFLCWFAGPAHPPQRLPPALQPGAGGAAAGHRRAQGPEEHPQLRAGGREGAGDGPEVCGIHVRIRIGSAQGITSGGQILSATFVYFTLIF